MMTSIKFVPYEMKTSLIKVYGYENKNLSGVLVNPYYEREMPFGSITQLLNLMSEMLDDLKYPQQTMGTRSFVKDQKQKAVEINIEIPDNQPVLASFKVNVLFRQNASWQGSAVWLENAVESPFRSVLELIMLFDSVLSLA